MYFPYLRGRQFELISIRELIQKGLLHKKIIPLIEPVTLSSTLLSTLKIFSEKSHDISLICNPSVGSFSKDIMEKEEMAERFNRKICFENVVSAYILDNNIENLLSTQEDKSQTLIVLDSPDNIDLFNSIFTDSNPRFVLFPDNSVYRRRIKENRVLLDDSFQKMQRNVDYLEVDDEFFSNDHLYYMSDGYLGYSDYSIVGDFFVESGFAPYAVAIHIVYFDGSMELRIKHFVSDSNDDISDPAGKFYEAVAKLYHWYQKEYNQKYNTFGLSSFIDLYENKGYPGLGVVKKLSIMHHLELISQYFGEE